MGHVIPGGTGFNMYRDVKLVPLAEPISIEEMPVAELLDGGIKMDPSESKEL